MRRPFLALGSLIAVACSLFGFVVRDSDPTVTVSTFGKQPALAVDKANNIKVVFGQADEIFYTASTNGGKSFSTPASVGRQPQLALGMTRGPQIVTTEDYTVIAAAAHTGKIMAYRKGNEETKWSEPVNILHADTTAKEGFVAVASGKGNTVYAAWLDLRLNRKNNVFFASSRDGGKTWSENTLVYASPQGGVCPCCRPSITADRKGNVYIMFRNELKGARDMYVAHSKDGGKSFGPAQKLGTGTWVLEACPMDGGAISVDASGQAGSIWRRENTVYYAEPGSAERKIGEGRAPSLAKTTKGEYLVWQQNGEIMALTPNKLAIETIGAGTYPRLAALSDQGVISVWESDGRIMAKRLP
ncbi:hypothetical protein GCM10023188_14470 [Pontibacter saemangeumensis]|uniref:Sialidase domain-containing protein n=1 Tax=Pontibacter saemangeumensis TaxID=1084525 RepID=A0ABP8LHR1_9BACT